MTPVRTAIIGFGLSGSVFHAPFLEASERFKLSVIMQRSGDLGRELYPGVRLARALEDVLEDELVELVVITTPNSLHFPMARAALMAGKHVIVEKPFAQTAEECRELIALAEKQQRQLFVFHNRRWDGDFMTVRRIVESRVLGDLVSYEAHYDRFSPHRSAKPWKEAAAPGVSVLHDLGTHIIDQAVCLFGLPAAVTAHLRKEREGSDILDGFELLLHYKNFHATLKSSLLVMEQGPRYVIHGRNGSFIKYGIDPQEEDMKAGFDPLDPAWGEEPESNWGMLTTRVNGLASHGTVQTLPGNYMYFYDNVAAVIRDGDSMAVSPKEAMLTVRLIEAAEESSRKRKTVDL